MMDLYSTTMWGDNTAVRVTESGTAFTPSLQDFTTDRPFHINELEGTDWEVEVSFADDGSNLADPVIVHNKKTGSRIGIVYQTGDDHLLRAQVISEIILNWLPTVLPALRAPWDVNSDGIVNIFDLVLVGKHFGESGDDIVGDVDNDGQVNIFDLVLVGSHFGEKTAPSIDNISLLQQIHDILKVVPNPTPNLKLALIELEKLLSPTETELLQNYPNPFNPETWIPFQLSEPVNVVISIYDVDGQLIRKIRLGKMPAGVYVSKDKAAYWDGKDSLGQQVVSSVYFYTLQAGEFRATKKMVILR